MSAHLMDCVEDSYESLVNLRHVCRSCGSLSLHLEDGWCRRCNSDELTDRQDERARSIRIGRERTAAMLERMGFPERAAIHRGER